MSCNLGCTLGGCSLTDIAQNQPIILVFDQDVDATSVSTASFSLRTSTGEEPVGSYLVSGSTVQFVPQIQVVGGASFFGFRANASYTLTLPGGTSQINALRSTSGDSLATTFTCNLAVTRGVIDLDGNPPVAKLLSPTATQNVDPRATIAIEFSEFIDATPFVGSTAQTSPVKVRVSKTRPAQGGGIECDPASAPIDLPGSWQISNDSTRQVTTISFVPLQAVPNSACVVVQVTNAIRDLSGKPSQGQGFQYLTIAGTQQDKSIDEPFDNSLNLDQPASSGTWGSGVATPGQLGGDGLHGEFDPSSGVSKGGGVFEWSTDNQKIPQDKTLSGKDEFVTDGVFRFLSFVLPRGQTVRFRGKNPVRLYVSGVAQIDGTVDLSGDTQAVPNPSPPGLGLAQPGALGGPGGGAGGKGADKGNSALGNQPNFNGANGEDVKVPATHAYASQAPGTGGRGSQQMPTDGKSVTGNYTFSLSAQVTAGGGGGGNSTAGTTGKVVSNIGTNPTGDSGPPAAGGTAFPVLPILGNPTVFDHFLVGGSGGGGSGSHPFLSTVSAPQWKPGGGGAGGGGAFGLRVGRDLLMGSSGVITANGGATANVNAGSSGYATLGGGGGAGSLVLQIAGVAVTAGQLQFAGGRGGSLTVPQIGSNPMLTQGGTGGDGVLRFEMPGKPPATPSDWVGQTIPPATSANLATLTEADAVVAQRSLWYQTRELFPPSYRRYELRATVDGQSILFSDDPAVGRLASGTEPVRFLIQCASVDAAGNIDPSTILPWRRYVGRFSSGGELTLADDGLVAFRFMLFFDRTTASQITLDKVSVFFQAF